MASNPIKRGDILEIYVDGASRAIPDLRRGHLY